MPTSDATLNAKLDSRNPQPLVEALEAFGQSWLVAALGEDMEAEGILTFVPDWTLSYVDPDDPQLDAATVAAMVAWSVAELGVAPAPAGNPGAGWQAVRPLYFRTREADLALWAGYTAQSQFTRHDARRLWARRVALSLVIDGAGLVPWRLRGFPAWQVAGMLGWRPEVGNTLRDVLEGSWRGHSPLLFNSTWHTDDFLWIPDAFTAHWAALSVIQAAKADSPRAALRALRTRMVQRRALHGQQEWMYFWCNDDADAPPGGVFEDNCNPAAGNDASLAQWLRRGWGGCSINSVALAALLRGVNVPAAMVGPVAVDLPADEFLSPSAGSWSMSRRIANSVRVRVAGGYGGRHIACYAFGAGLACSHGDMNVSGVANGAVFGDDTLSGWLPWRLQTAMHGWAALAPNNPASDTSGELGEAAWRSHLESAIDAASNDPMFAHSMQPWQAWLQVQAGAVTAANWTAATPSGAATTLRRWLFAVSLWPCGQPMPGLHGLARLCRAHAGSLPRPRWTPLFNDRFFDSTAPMRQALARARRELLTPMSGVITSDPAPMPREAFSVQVDSHELSADGSVAVRVVTLALLALEALQDGSAAALETVRLLAAHAYDVTSLSSRAASGPAVPGLSAMAELHGTAFPNDVGVWFRGQFGAPILNGPQRCGAETARMIWMIQASEGMIDSATAIDLAQGATDQANISDVSPGGDPLAFLAFGPAFGRACAPTLAPRPPFDEVAELVSALDVCVSALLGQDAA